MTSRARVAGQQTAVARATHAPGLSKHFRPIVTACLKRSRSAEYTHCASRLCLDRTFGGRSGGSKCLRDNPTYQQLSGYFRREVIGGVHCATANDRRM